MKLMACGVIGVVMSFAVANATMTGQPSIDSSRLGPADAAGQEFRAFLR
jgi:hypothetical protein